MQAPKRATLILEDGTRYEGKSFGFEGSTAGEVVFNTAMTGYPESLTDPSYEGQILVTTFPLLGNYGVPPSDDRSPSLRAYYEGSRIHCRAIVAQDYAFHHSHWLAERSLAKWLKEEKIPGIYDIDTRALTKHLREHGSMLGKIIIEGSEAEDDVDFYDPNAENLIAKTSTTAPAVYESIDAPALPLTPATDTSAWAEESRNGRKTVVLVDCGIKHNIIRCLLKRGVRVVRVPWDYDFSALPYDGLFISNGPGNPDFAEATVENIRKAMADGSHRPICGICMGNQLLAKAAGASTYKLKYGHRSHNQPVRRKGTNSCYVTSQNHGFAVDDSTLPDGWEALFVNMNDGTNEGIRHRELPYFSAQFHPEASSGPRDTEFLFDEFLSKL
ncbi:MAG: glutamine-hydrolyzing carbamoyl-phosphate synthase small subunit [Muribaculaceae bacterium]|nr:glutamine-hydrolyzing carbamoyl-phosphate synthase small subunit [Muribaculaceae bacterium]